ncbi:MAG: DUF2812 domain-containing protein [Clostridia bacterium]|nr:DUF2812 domain-containing protein [Clostridia bacterium]
MNIRTEFKWFTIFHYEAEQEYLRRMHKNGWKFIKVSGGCIYRFEKAEPEDIIYQIDYNKDAADHEEYIKMFEDCGWEYLQDYAGQCYFRKPAVDMKSGEESIFCDDASRLAMLERVFKGRMVPLVILFSGFLLPHFIMSLKQGNFGFSAVLGCIMFLYMGRFCNCAVHYFKLKK